MPWYHGIAEVDHEIQNPTSRDKILELGRRLRLGPGAHVLDIASGLGGPALILAAEFGCRVTGIEQADEFHAVACERARSLGLDPIVRFVHGDAREVALGRGDYDAALCLGASFVWNGLEGTLAALTPSVRGGGHVCVGEPYWRRWPLPEGVDGEGFVPLEETVHRFESAGLPVVALITASEDDWDRYVTLGWRAVEEWLAAHDDAELRREHEARKARYLGWQRELMGWAILAGRKESGGAG